MTLPSRDGPSRSGPCAWAGAARQPAPPCSALPSQDPKPLPYLRHDRPYTFDINLSVTLKGTVTASRVCPGGPCAQCHRRMLSPAAASEPRGALQRKGGRDTPRATLARRALAEYRCALASWGQKHGVQDLPPLPESLSSTPTPARVAPASAHTPLVTPPSSACRKAWLCAPGPHASPPHPRPGQPESLADGPRLRSQGQQSLRAQSLAPQTVAGAHSTPLSGGTRGKGRGLSVPQFVICRMLRTWIPAKV